ncbi:Hypothetical predicted protein [Xyrichtys novacula]|uniref:Uncharacterized protein n=1 Tax=Xyrichtys novacula TaxID=13765 RepID=A0AAV1H9R2_XYRNO|nr:Hypothetical predicted protein [Xyrichtys novacula]
MQRLRYAHSPDAGLCKNDRGREEREYSSVPADSMSRPTLQQGQSHAISQAYSALLRPCSRRSTQGLVELGLHEVYCNCHASWKEGSDNDAITVTVSEEVCLRQRRTAVCGDDRLSRITKRAKFLQALTKQLKI